MSFFLLWDSQIIGKTSAKKESNKNAPAFAGARAEMIQPETRNFIVPSRPEFSIVPGIFYAQNEVI